MSQQSVERILGRLVTDEGFRERFFADPEAACLQIGAGMSRQELDALKRIPPTALADLCSRIDDRICRLHIAAQPLSQEQPR